jgi:hypothetical protein
MKNPQTTSEIAFFFLSPLHEARDQTLVEALGDLKSLTNFHCR